MTAPETPLRRMEGAVWWRVVHAPAVTTAGRTLRKAGGAARSSDRRGQGTRGHRRSPPLTARRTLSEARQQTRVGRTKMLDARRDDRRSLLSIALGILHTPSVARKAPGTPAAPRSSAPIRSAGVMPRSGYAVPPSRRFQDRYSRRPTVDTGHAPSAAPRLCHPTPPLRGPRRPGQGPAGPPARSQRAR